MNIGTLQSFRKHRTRYTAQTGIVYIMQCAGLWRHVDTADSRQDEAPRVVGPQYATEHELLSDHERYMRANWL